MKWIILFIVNTFYPTTYFKNLGVEVYTNFNSITQKMEELKLLSTSVNSSWATVKFE